MKLSTLLSVIGVLGFIAVGVWISQTWLTNDEIVVSSNDHQVLLQQQMDTQKKLVNQVADLAERQQASDEIQKELLNLLKNQADDIPVNIIQEPLQVVQEDISPEEQQERIIRHVDSVFVFEEVDEEWAIQTESEFKGSISSQTTFSGSSIQDAECRSSMCRVVVVHDNYEALAQFEEEIPFMEPWATSAVIKTVEEGGKVKSIMFVSREGHDLPQAAPE